MRANLAALITHGVVVCPSCRGALERHENDIHCVVCKRSYALADVAIPILLTEESLFTPNQVLERSKTYYERKASESPLKRRIRRSLPTLASDASGPIVDAILKRSDRSDALGFVVGGGERVASMDDRLPAVSWLVSDVDLSYAPDLIADAHEIPIADAMIDVVMAEMVLEHLIDPSTAARELQRICRLGGLIVVTVPFCFPWHGIPWDFQRWTPSGLRALFNWTEVVYLGPGQGPAGALAYEADALLVNFSSRRLVRAGLAFVSRFAFGWLKCLDRVSADRPGVLVSAGSLTYVGRKLAAPISRRKLLVEITRLQP